MKITSQREYDECKRTLHELNRQIKFATTASEHELANAGWIDRAGNFYDFDLADAMQRSQELRRSIAEEDLRVERRFF